jgi:2-polyprenyl-6-methoxyphenol hydroxylase-like FAD-dependent oxidoreductase
MNTTSQVIIVGAGPVGLTAALLLGTKGIHVTVLEAGAAISQELRASTFHPPTLDIVAPYGITQKMLEAGLLCPTWQIRLHPSGERAVFDLSVLQDESEHPYRLQCEQSKYCQFVLDAVRELPHVTVMFSTPVSQVQQTSDSATVTATTPDGERTFTAQYVIGADGARSAVRRSLGIELSGDIYPETTILAKSSRGFPTFPIAGSRTARSACYACRASGASAFMRATARPRKKRCRTRRSRICCTTSCRTPAASRFWKPAPIGFTGAWRHPMAGAVCSSPAMPRISTAPRAAWA